MGPLAIICGLVMLVMLYTGLYYSFEPEREQRIVGVCTTVWAVVALYLYVFQWMLVPRHEVQSLIAITLLSTAGFMVGRTLAWFTRWEWAEE